MPLAPGVDLTAYRIVQEALTNTIRHASAGRAAVTVRYEPGYITVSVDRFRAPRRRAVPGRGQRQRHWDRRTREPAPLLTGAGFGLAGIAERVASCGGNLTVGPTQRGRLRRDRAAAGPMTTRARGEPARPDPIRVLVVDDQELVRSGFCVILDTADGHHGGGGGRQRRDGAGRRGRAAIPTWC